MKAEDFDVLSRLVKTRSGLVLTGDKADLVEGRLVALARRRGLTGPGELIARLRGRRDEALAREVTRAVAADESFFFRDFKAFELFRLGVLPRLIQARAVRRTFRIWCAAAGTGQEPYSLAMILRQEAARLAGWRHEIVATDAAGGKLAKARAGIYSQFEVQRGLPIRLLLAHFTGRDGMWQIDASLRAMVRFHEHDPAADPAPLGRFDVVFCRNVLIGFDPAGKARLLARIATVMAEDGVLFLGGTETVLGVSDRFKPIPGRRDAYCLAGTAAERCLYGPA